MPLLSGSPRPPLLAMIGPIIRFISSGVTGYFAWIVLPLRASFRGGWGFWAGMPPPWCELVHNTLIQVRPDHLMMRIITQCTFKPWTVGKKTLYTIDPSDRLDLEVLGFVCLPHWICWVPGSESQMELLQLGCCDMCVLPGPAVAACPDIRDIAWLLGCAGRMFTVIFCHLPADLPWRPTVYSSLLHWLSAQLVYIAVWWQLLEGSGCSTSHV